MQVICLRKTTAAGLFCNVGAMQAIAIHSIGGITLMYSSNIFRTWISSSTNSLLHKTNKKRTKIHFWLINKHSHFVFSFHSHAIGTSASNDSFLIWHYSKTPYSSRLPLLLSPLSATHSAITAQSIWCCLIRHNNNRSEWKKNSLCMEHNFSFPYSV